LKEDRISYYRQKVEKERQEKWDDFQKKAKEKLEEFDSFKGY